MNVVRRVFRGQRLCEWKDSEFLTSPYDPLERSINRSLGRIRLTSSFGHFRVSETVTGFKMACQSAPNNRCVSGIATNYSGSFPNKLIRDFAAPEMFEIK